METYKDYYETYVVKNPTEKTIPRKLAGGEVTAWSVGHKLLIADVFRAALEKISDGSVAFPADYAARLLAKVRTYESRRNSQIMREVSK